MSAEISLPHPIPEARRATHEGKYGLQNMGFRAPDGSIAHVTTIDGYTGPEFMITDPNGNVSYWTNNGSSELICGILEEGQFTGPIWAVSAPPSTQR